jgi:hypothetical protein
MYNSDAVHGSQFTVEMKRFQLDFPFEKEYHIRRFTLKL